MVYITIHRLDAIPRLLQLGADLVHGVVKGAGQAVEGLPAWVLRNLGEGRRALSSRTPTAMPATIPLRKVHVFIVFTFFVAFLSFIGLCTVCPAEVKKMRKKTAVFLAKRGAELV